jgi:hypothetical protein
MGGVFLPDDHPKCATRGQRTVDMLVKTNPGRVDLLEAEFLGGKGFHMVVPLNPLAGC